MTVDALVIMHPWCCALPLPGESSCYITICSLSSCSESEAFQVLLFKSLHKTGHLCSTTTICRHISQRQMLIWLKLGWMLKLDRVQMTYLLNIFIDDNHMYRCLSSQHRGFPTMSLLHSSVTGKFNLMSIFRPDHKRLYFESYIYTSAVVCW